VTVTAPGAPSAALYDTADTVAVGSAAKGRWDKVADASSYEARLYRNGSVVSTQETGETLATFVLNNAGAYEIRGRAINFVGGSAESHPPVAVEAMALCKVVFKDWDGTVITEASVDYGAAPTFPKTPSRAGHDFAGWTVAAGTRVYADTAIEATYTVKIFTVDFYDTDGTTRLSSQRVEYGKAATPPTAYSIAAGYAFAGWHVAPGSAGTG
jgi:hypothetical protein